jgi:repressor LexA
MSTIRQCRKKQGLSQKALAELCHVDQTSVSKWELGKSYPDVTVAIQLSSYFGVSLDSIYENPIKFGSVCLPVHKHLLPEQLTGKPAFAEEYLEIGMGDLSRYLTRAELSGDNSVREQLGGQFFALAVTGKTMESRFMDGDTVLVKKQAHVDNNQIAVVCVDSEEARLFQIKWHRKGVVLHSLNTSFEPVFYTKSECDAGYITILGLVVELRGKTL